MALMFISEIFLNIDFSGTASYPRVTSAPPSPSFQEESLANKQGQPKVVQTTCPLVQMQIKQLFTLKWRPCESEGIRKWDEETTRSGILWPCNLLAEGGLPIQGNFPTPSLPGAFPFGGPKSQVEPLSRVSGGWVAAAIFPCQFLFCSILSSGSSVSPSFTHLLLLPLPTGTFHTSS